MFKDAYIKYDTTNMTEEEWLEKRKEGVGGSDCNNIVGSYKYTCKDRLYLIKRGEMEPSPIDPEGLEKIEHGKFLEPFILQRFIEKHEIEAKPLKAILVNKDRDWQRATIDAYISDEIGLEIKCSYNPSMWYVGKELEDGQRVPESYYWQCQHYMAVTGAKEWWLFADVQGSTIKYMLYKIKRDEWDIAFLNREEEKFWNCVQNGKLPGPDDSDDYMRLQLELRGEQPLTKKKHRAIETDVDNMINEYTEIAAAENKLKNRKRSIKNQLVNIALENNAKYIVSNSRTVELKKNYTRKTKEFSSYSIIILGGKK
jgi:putative phage-type endonuclease